MHYIWCFYFVLNMIGVVMVVVVVVEGRPLQILKPCVPCPSWLCGQLQVWVLAVCSGCVVFFLFFFGVVGQRVKAYDLAVGVNNACSLCSGGD